MLEPGEPHTGLGGAERGGDLGEQEMASNREGILSHPGPRGLERDIRAWWEIVSLRCNEAQLCCPCPWLH